MFKMLKTYFAIFLSWCLFVSVGSLIGASLASFLTTNFFLLLFLLGLFIGLGQWTVINFRLKRVWSWIPATAIGFPLGLYISIFVVSISFIILDFPETPSYPEYSEYSYSAYLAHSEVWNQWFELMVAMGTGVFTGLLQWLALQREMEPPLKWLLISGLSLAIAYKISVIFYHANANTPAYSSFSIPPWLIFGLVFGLTTGAFVGPLLLRAEID
jgi:hypothetical protein